MPRRVKLVVLCEDAQHHSFAAAFLNRANLPTGGRPRYIPCDGKTKVLAAFPAEVRALLASEAETHLLVLVDADGDTLEHNIEALLGTLDAEMRARISENDRWLAICPNWEIENWIRHLEGKPVTEELRPQLALTQPSECRDVARTLADQCRARRMPKNPLPSLEGACTAWRAYLERHDL